MSNLQESGPLLSVRDVAKFYGARVGCRDVSFDLWPGEVMGIVGESGSGRASRSAGCCAGPTGPLFTSTPMRGCG